MISRRGLLVGSAALSVAPRPRRITNDLRVRHCEVCLEDADVRVLTGLPAEELAPLAWPDGTQDRFIEIGVSGNTGLLRFGDLPRRRLEFMNGGEGFVSAWAYSISFHGYIGYQPSLDVPLAFAGGDGEFWRSPFDRLRLPRSLGTAKTAQVTFFTAPGVTLQQVNERLVQIQDATDPRTDLVVTSYVEPHFEPCVLLSLFGTRS